MFFFLLMHDIQHLFICLKFICISFLWISWLYLVFIFGHNNLSKLLFFLFYVSYICTHVHTIPINTVCFFPMFIYGKFAFLSVIWLNILSLLFKKITIFFFLAEFYGFCVWIYKSFFYAFRFWFVVTKTFPTPRL